MSDDLDFDPDEFMSDMDDDFGDGPDMEGLSDGPAESDRSIAGQVKAGALETALSASSAQAAGRAIRENVLPKGYAGALDDIDEIASAGEEIYDSAEKALEPAVDSMKSALRSTESVIEKILPEGIASRIKDFAEDTSYSRDYVDPDESAIQASLSEIFTQEREVDAVRDDYTVKRDEASEHSSDLRHTQTIAVDKEIAVSIGRLVGYQDSILVNYQRKSLELQHRTYFTLRDLLGVSKPFFETNISHLQNIQHNTGLPDTVKYKATERLGEIMQDGMLGNMSEGIGRFTSKYTSELKNNVKDVVMDFAETLSSGIEGAADMAEQMSGDDDGGPSAGQMAGGAAVEYASGKLGERAARKLGSFFAKNKSVGRLNDLLRYHSGNKAAALQAFVEEGGDVTEMQGYQDLVAGANNMASNVGKKKDKAISWFVDAFGMGDTRVGKRVTDGVSARAKARDLASNPGDDDDVEVSTPGAFGKMVNAAGEFLKEVAPSYSDDLSMGGKLEDNLSTATSFDTITHRSINEIIPGYLSRILQTVAKIAGESGDRIVYSTQKEAFITTEENDNLLAQKMVSDEDVVHKKRAAYDAVDELDKDRTLSDEAREALAERMMLVRDKRTGFAVSDFSDEDFYTKKYGAEIGEEISGKLNAVNADRDGRHMQEIQKKFKRMRARSLDADKVTSSLHYNGQREALERLGLLTYKEDGSSAISAEAWNDMRLGSNIAEGTDASNHMGAIAGERDIRDRARFRGPRPEGYAHIEDDGRILPQPPPEAAVEEDTSVVSRLFGFFGGARRAEETEEDPDAHRSESDADDVEPPPPPGLFGRIDNWLSGRSEPNPSSPTPTPAEVPPTPTPTSPSGDASESSQPPSPSGDPVPPTPEQGEGVWGRIRRGLSPAERNDREIALQYGDTPSAVEETEAVVVESTTASLTNTSDLLERAAALLETAPIPREVEDESPKSAEELTALEKAKEHLSSGFSTADIFEGYSDLDPGFRSVVESIDGNSRTTHLLLQSIAEGVVSGGGSGGVKLGALASGVFGTMKSGVGTLTGLLGSYYKGMGKVAGAAASVLGGGVKTVTRGVTSYFTDDIYIKGDSEPVLTARGMKSGKYFDEESGDPIKSLKDIKGPVVNATGNVILTADDIETGLVEKGGKSISDLLSPVTRAVSGVFGVQTAIIKGAYGAGKWLLNTASRSLKRRDVYVDGESTPRLLSRLMLAGRYTDKDGRPIKAITDINGDVYEGENIVLTVDDIKQGLVDKNGVTLGSGGLLRALTGYSGKAIGKAFSMGSTIAKGLAKTTVKLNRGIFSATRGAGAAGLRGLKSKDSVGTGYMSADAVPHIDEQTGVLKKILTRIMEFSTSAPTVSLTLPAGMTMAAPAAPQLDAEGKPMPVDPDAPPAPAVMVIPATPGAPKENAIDKLGSLFNSAKNTVTESKIANSLVEKATTLKDSVVESTTLKDAMTRVSNLSEIGMTTVGWAYEAMEAGNKEEALTILKRGMSDASDQVTKSELAKAVKELEKDIKSSKAYKSASSTATAVADSKVAQSAKQMAKDTVSTITSSDFVTRVKNISETGRTSLEWGYEAYKKGNTDEALEILKRGMEDARDDVTKSELARVLKDVKTKVAKTKAYKATGKLATEVSESKAVKKVKTAATDLSDTITSSDFVTRVKNISEIGKTSLEWGYEAYKKGNKEEALTILKQGMADATDEVTKSELAKVYAQVEKTVKSTDAYKATAKKATQLKEDIKHSTVVANATEVLDDVANSDAVKRATNIAKVAGTSAEWAIDSARKGNYAEVGTILSDGAKLVGQEIAESDVGKAVGNSAVGKAVGSAVDVASDLAADVSDSALGQKAKEVAKTAASKAEELMESETVKDIVTHTKKLKEETLETIMASDTYIRIQDVKENTAASLEMAREAMAEGDHALAKEFMKEAAEYAAKSAKESKVGSEVGSALETAGKTISESTVVKKAKELKGKVADSSIGKVVKTATADVSDTVELASIALKEGNVSLAMEMLTGTESKPEGVKQAVTPAPATPAPLPGSSPVVIPTTPVAPVVPETVKDALSIAPSPTTLTTDSVKPTTVLAQDDITPGTTLTLSQINDAKIAAMMEDEPEEAPPAPVSQPTVVASPSVTTEETPVPVEHIPVKPTVVQVEGAAPDAPLTLSQINDAKIAAMMEEAPTGIPSVPTITQVHSEVDRVVDGKDTVSVETPPADRGEEESPGTPRELAQRHDDDMLSLMAASLNSADRVPVSLVQPGEKQEVSSKVEMTPVQVNDLEITRLMGESPVDETPGRTLAPVPLQEHNPLEPDDTVEEVQLPGTTTEESELVDPTLKSELLVQLRMRIDKGSSPLTWDDTVDLKDDVFKKAIALWKAEDYSGAMEALELTIPKKRKPPTEILPDTPLTLAQINDAKMEELMDGNSTGTDAPVIGPSRVPQRADSEAVSDLMEGITPNSPDTPLTLAQINDAKMEELMREGSTGAEVPVVVSATQEGIVNPPSPDTMVQEVGTSELSVSERNDLLIAQAMEEGPTPPETVTGMPEELRVALAEAEAAANTPFPGMEALLDVPTSDSTSPGIEEVSEPPLDEPRVFQPNSDYTTTRLERLRRRLRDATSFDTASANAAGLTEEDIVALELAAVEEQVDTPPTPSDNVGPEIITPGTEDVAGRTFVPNADFSGGSRMDRIRNRLSGLTSINVSGTSGANDAGLTEEEYRLLNPEPATAQPHTPELRASIAELEELIRNTPSSEVELLESRENLLSNLKEMQGTPTTTGTDGPGSNPGVSSGPENALLLGTIGELTSLIEQNQELGEDEREDMSTQTELLSDLVKMQEASTAGPNANDADGDGDRDGSWQDQEQEEDEQNRRNLRRANTLGSIPSVGGAVGWAAGKAGEYTNRAKDAVVNKAMDVGGRVVNKAKDVVIDTAKAVGGKVMQTVARVAATVAATSVATSVATTAATAAAALGVGTLMLGLGVLAVVGVAAWGAYKLTKHLTYGSDVQPVEGLRFLQYGVSLKDEDFIYAIRALEDQVRSEIDLDKNGSPTLNEEPAYFYEEHHEAFNRLLDDRAHGREWNTWFRKRFIPVFYTHIQAAYRLDDGVDILDIDDEMDDKDQAMFINRVQITEKDIKRGFNPYAVLATPFNGKPVYSMRDIVLDYTRRMLETLMSDSELDDFDFVPGLPGEDKNKSRNDKKRTDAEEKARKENERDPNPPTEKKGKKKAIGLVAGALVGASVIYGGGDDLGRKSKMMIPAEGRISSPYGWRKHPIGGERSFHKGIDIAAPKGTPVVAAMDGRVMRSHYSPSYGNVVYLRHADGTSTRYAHMNSRARGLHIGDTVLQGQLLGTVGNTGLSDGNHLHFEWRKNLKQWGPTTDPVSGFRSVDKTAAVNEIKTAEEIAKGSKVEGQSDGLEGVDTLAAKQSPPSAKLQKLTDSASPASDKGSSPTAPVPEKVVAKRHVVTKDEIETMSEGKTPVEIGVMQRKYTMVSAMLSDLGRPGITMQEVMDMKPEAVSALVAEKKALGNTMMANKYGTAPTMPGVTPVQPTTRVTPSVTRPTSLRHQVTAAEIEKATEGLSQLEIGVMQRKYTMVSNTLADLGKPGMSMMQVASMSATEVGALMEEKKSMGNTMMANKYGSSVTPPPTEKPRTSTLPYDRSKDLERNLNVEGSRLERALTAVNSIRKRSGKHPLTMRQFSKLSAREAMTFISDDQPTPPATRNELASEEHDAMVARVNAKQLPPEERVTVKEPVSKPPEGITVASKLQTMRDEQDAKEMAYRASRRQESVKFTPVPVTRRRPEAEVSLTPRKRLSASDGLALRHMDLASRTRDDTVGAMKQQIALSIAAEEQRNTMINNQERMIEKLETIASKDTTIVVKGDSSGNSNDSIKKALPNTDTTVFKSVVDFKS